MSVNFAGGDDTDSLENWDACWRDLENLPSRDLPTAALHAEAARIINSCRALTEGRGIEQIEERARNAYRLASGRLAVASDDSVNRYFVTLDGALSVLRRVSRESIG